MTLQSFIHYKKYLKYRYCFAKFFSDIIKKLKLYSLSIKLNNFFHEGIQLYLQDRYLTVLRKAEEDVKSITLEETKYDNSIFVCWLQGIESAPNIVKACYNQLKENANGRNIVLITEENLTTIIKFPEYIIKKFREGKITKTHLTDLIRMQLIYEFGGAWIDSTIYTTMPLHNKIFESDFFTIKRNNSSPFYVPKGKWTAYFLASKKGCPFGYIAKTILWEYWKNNSELIDYFLIDHIINFCYENSSICRYLIDSVPINNTKCDFFKGKYNNKYDENQWSKIKQETTIFKLSYKEAIKTNLSETYYDKLFNSKNWKN